MKNILFIASLIFTLLNIQVYSEEKGKIYKYDLAITAIFRDDAPYLKEWIEFHRVVGVEHFYMINNLSVDNYLEVLQPYIDKGVVDLIEWPYEHDKISCWNVIQCQAYEYVIDLVKGKVKWLALIDTDEFLFPVKKDNLLNVLSKYEKFGGLAVNWQVYGTSFVPKVSESELMIEMLTLRAPVEAEVNRHVKSIVRPEYVARCDNPHYVHYKKGRYQVNSDREKFYGPFSPYIQINAVRINHYTVRDEYYLHHYKLPRISKWCLDAKAFEEGYESLNQIYDDSIFRFIPQLKERIFME